MTLPNPTSILSGTRVFSSSAKMWRRTPFYSCSALILSSLIESYKNFMPSSAISIEQTSLNIPTKSSTSLLPKFRKFISSVAQSETSLLL